jgi:hypothetical protein
MSLMRLVLCADIASKISMLVDLNGESFSYKFDRSGLGWNCSEELSLRKFSLLLIKIRPA